MEKTKMHYMWRCFETKAEAKAYQKWRGGVLYSLEKEKKKLGTEKKPEALAVIMGADTEKYKYSVEWNECDYV